MTNVQIHSRWFTTNTPTQAVQQANKLLKEEGGELVAMVIVPIGNSRVKINVQYIKYEILIPEKH